MRYGVNVPNIGDLDLLLELGVEIELGDWDGFFVWDQMGFLVGVPATVFDPWVLLAALAERTERIRWGRWSRRSPGGAVEARARDRDP